MIFKKQILWLSTILLISTFLSLQAIAQDEIKSSQWMTEGTKKNLVTLLNALFLSGVLAERNKPELLRTGAIATVNKFDDYLWNSEVDTIIANAPSFRTPGYPRNKEQKLDAMGRYQLCNALFTVMLPPNYQPSTSALHFAMAAGLTMSSMAMLYIQTSREGPASDIDSYTTSDDMAALMERMLKENEVRTVFFEDCTAAMEPYSQAIE